MARGRQYSPEVKARAVRTVLDSGRPIAQVAKDLDVGSESLRTWVRQARTDAGGHPGAPTVADPAGCERPDLVNRDFTATRPDALWIADFTYLKSWEGVGFFSFVLDVYSRRCVGWHWRATCAPISSLTRCGWVMAQMGHADPRLTLQVYAQVIQRQRVEHELVWQLMRFGDEVERWPGARRRTSDPTIDPLPLGSITADHGKLFP